MPEDRDAGAGPVVRTRSGPVRGRAGEGVEAFLGLPYAAPPVGKLRWRPPQRVKSWRGVRDATAFGARAAAAESSNGPRSEAEDCLFLNVWRPEGAEDGAKLPVYVFIHGGGLMNGSSDQCDMTQFVARTGVVGVSLNYRLGVLGFLAHPALTAESGESGNWGLMDQQAALRWVRDNIGAFGGDPKRVTVGGESAGGWSVCAHLVAPGSEGLFSGAMVQSGSAASLPLQDAEALGLGIAEALGCAGPDALARLRALPVARLIDLPYPGEVPHPVHFTPFLPSPIQEAIRAGAFQRVPVVIGATRDEGRTFMNESAGWTEAEYAAWVRDWFGGKAERVLAEYSWPADGGEFTGAYLAGEVVTDSGAFDGIGGCGNLRLTREMAQHTQVWAYEFAHRTGPGLTPEPMGFEWGAGHAAELAYLFPSFDNGTPIAPRFGEAERRLSREMTARWGAFVARGAPEAEGLAAWPAFNEGGQVLSLRGKGSMLVPEAEIARQHRWAFWEGLGAA
ncbi:Carboxylesterase, type B [Rubellimicrobium mesophilum DSM 19309]|uniref:Carboxylic ester hydrolase n=1 Tax=Rubellimicrobium mesophilum DSM 19309 TaxID=442562 RepID=A0A017HQL7_9RHOB|nr:carboxylesterase family protein [Rubellimicrobium mesophilum]EYD76463.1 Carboxylesterase, type B [Rubellimicrobium mesophilum DSM 19309]